MVCSPIPTICAPGLIFTLIIFLTRISAKCVNPTIRKEWNALASEERSEWISAVKCLSKLPHDNALAPSVFPSDIPPVNKLGSFYDDIVYIHMDLNIRIHFTGLFLPWHRWYLHVYETALKSKCNYRGTSPYFDWTKASSDFFRASVFQDNDTSSGLGGWGDPSRDFAVPSGGFSDLALSYPSRHILRRNFTIQPYKDTSVLPPGLFTDPDSLANSSFTPGKVKALINGHIGQFKEFQQDLEGFENMHSSVHLIMGGDMGGTCPQNAPKNCTPGPTWSANEPIFWLHHAMIDKIWSDWAKKDPRNNEHFFGGSVQHIENSTIYQKYPNGGPPWLSINSTMPADGLFPAATIGDVLSTTNGLLCYDYV